MDQDLGKDDGLDEEVNEEEVVEAVAEDEDSTDSSEDEPIREPEFLEADFDAGTTVEIFDEDKWRRAVLYRQMASSSKVCARVCC